DRGSTAPDARLPLRRRGGRRHRQRRGGRRDSPDLDRTRIRASGIHSGAPEVHEPAFRDEEGLTMLRDIRFGFRLLSRTPLFAVAALTILALGVGATTAVFTV